MMIMKNKELELEFELKHLSCFWFSAISSGSSIGGLIVGVIVVIAVVVI